MCLVLFVFKQQQQQQQQQHHQQQQQQQQQHQQQQQQKQQQQQQQQQRQQQQEEEEQQEEEQQQEEQQQEEQEEQKEQEEQEQASMCFARGSKIARWRHGCSRWKLLAWRLTRHRGQKIHLATYSPLWWWYSLIVNLPRPIQSLAFSWWRLPGKVAPTCV